MICFVLLPITEDVGREIYLSLFWKMIGASFTLKFIVQ